MMVGLPYQILKPVIKWQWSKPYDSGLKKNQTVEFKKREILGTHSSSSKNIEHTGSNTEPGKAITLKEMLEILYQYGE